MLIYECYVDYDVLASYSLAALKGYAFPVRISQTPLIYDLYYGRYEKNPDANPGELFGQFELRRRPSGASEIIFHDKTHLLQYNREWTDEEKEGGASLEGDEQLKYVMQVQKKMWGEKENRQAELRVHLKKVVEVFFRYLEDWDIKFDVGVQPKEPPKPPEPKGKGGKIETWLIWREDMLNNGFKCTLNDVANKSGYSEGYIKQKNMEHKARPN